ncbi:hypothetical protein [Parasitella parasitica]|uniref:Methyltransferase domain-containing protein n=1 Tax=Parasitella parasitica TaxID=35722 RepID=A0A0B7NFU1_9FUNG|nr:hypothetical protein [Parasitella parasitica]
MSKEKNKHTLLTWLQHIKRHHDRKPPVSTSNEQKYTVNSDPVKVQHASIPIAKSSIEPPAAGRANAAVNSFDEKSTTKSLFPDGTDRPRFKSNLIHFHRPHGLLFHNHSSNTTDYSNNDTDKQHEISDNTTDTSRQLQSGSCACCSRTSTSINDADDEWEEQEEGEDDSVRSKDWTKHPPCFCTTNISMATPGDDPVTSQNIGAEYSSRENSVFSLPDDIDSPNVGFKKLKRDGDLVDWDELSTLEQADEDVDDQRSKSRLFTRSAIRNDLVQLALNGPFQSPMHLESKKHVLHVGCGDGTWCTETAILCPNWLVVGIDDKTGGPCPDQRKVPKNFKYIRCYYDNLETLKDMPAESFDFIYARFLLDAYGDDCYQDLVQECQRICKPEGYVELYELDMRIYGNPKAGPTTHKLNAKVFQTMESHDLNPRLARKLGDLTSSIFESHNQEPLDQDSDHTRRRKKKHFDSKYTSLPLGVWGGRLGVIFRDSINDLFMDFIQHGDIDSAASDRGSISSSSDGIPYNEDIEIMNRELDSRKAFMNLHHVYARKCSAH